MLRRVVLPHLAANLPRAVMSEWHVAPGDRVAYGTAICDVSVTERLRVSSGSSRANVLLRVARRRAARNSHAEVESDRFQVRYRVVASEPATITELQANAGSVVEVGSLLALASTDGVGADPSDPADSPALRVVASIVSGR